jgi:hypothetical protein
MFQWQISVWLITVRKKAMAYFKVLSQHLPEVTGVNQHNLKKAVVWADILTHKHNE